MSFFLNLNLAEITGIFIQGAGFIMLFIVLMPFINSIKAKNWSTAFGKITHSAVYKSDSMSDSGATYRPDIVFEYSVFGEKFVSAKVYYGVKTLSSGNLSNCQKLVQKYPANKDVTVYYNPLRPKQSVIEPWVHFGLGAIFAVAVCLIITGVVIYQKNDLLIGLIEQFK
jgi:hypothetical protein